MVRSGSVCSKIVSAIVIMVLIVSMIQHVPRLEGVEEVVYYPSTYQYTIVWKKWIIHVKIETELPWTLGEVASLNMTFKLVSSVENSKLYISEVSVKTPQPTMEGYHKDMASTYGGKFPNPTNTSTVNLKFRVVPTYFNISKVGVKASIDVPLEVSLIEETDVGIETYKETFYMSVEVISIPSRVEVDIEGAKNAYSGVEAPYTIRFKNNGPMPIHSLEVILLIDGDEYYREWIGDLEVGGEGSRHVRVKLEKVGPHFITAKLNYQEFDGTPSTREYTIPVYIYETLEVSLYSNKDYVGLNDTIIFTLITRPPPPEPLNAYLEVSSDFGATWRIENRFLVNVNGTAKISYTLVDPQILKSSKIYFRVKVETPGSGGLLYSTSNIIVLETKKETIATQPTTTPTPKPTVEKLSVILNANTTNPPPGGSVEFFVEVAPKISCTGSLERLSLGVWASIGNIDIVDGVGRILVKAPEEAGTYSYRVSVSYQNVEYVSNIVNLNIKKVEETTTTIERRELFAPEILGGIVVVVFLAAAILWWRRR